MREKDRVRERERESTTYDIDQDIQWIALPTLDQLSSIVLRPFRLILRAKVAAEGLLAPAAVARVGDRGESRDGFVLARVF